MKTIALIALILAAPIYLLTLPAAETVTASRTFTVLTTEDQAVKLTTGTPSSPFAKPAPVIAPYIESPASPPRTTILAQSSEFLNRFTDAELEAIVTAARTDAKIGVFLLRLSTTYLIAGDNAQVGGAMDYLVALKLISTERKAVILAP